MNSDAQGIVDPAGMAGTPSRIEEEKGEEEDTIPFLESILSAPVTRPVSDKRKKKKEHQKEQKQQRMVRGNANEKVSGTRAKKISGRTKQNRTDKQRKAPKNDDVSSVLITEVRHKNAAHTTMTTEKTDGKMQSKTVEKSRKRKRQVNLPRRPDESHKRKRLGLPDDSEAHTHDLHHLSTVNITERSKEEYDSAGIRETRENSKDEKGLGPQLQALRATRCKRKRDNETVGQSRNFTSLIPETVELTQHDLTRNCEHPPRSSQKGIADAPKTRSASGSRGRGKGDLNSTSFVINEATFKAADTVLSGAASRGSDSLLTQSELAGAPIDLTRFMSNEEKEEYAELRAEHGGQFILTKNQPKPARSPANATEAYPMALRKCYAIADEPKISFDAPLLGDELEGAIFYIADDKVPALEIRDGEVTAVVPPFGSSESRKTDPTIEEREEALFGKSLGSGQSIKATYEVLDKAALIRDNAETTKEKKTSSSRNGRGTPQSHGTTAIQIEAKRLSEDLALKSIVDSDTPYSELSAARKPYGTEEAATYTQEYLFRLSHVATELWAIVGQPKYGEHFGMAKDQLGDLTQFYPNVAIRSRASEERYLRQPIGSERPCAQGTACEGNYIRGDRACTLTEYPNSEDAKYFRDNGYYPEGSVAGLCVMCSRDNLFYLYAHLNSLCQAYRAGTMPILQNQETRPETLHKGSPPEPKLNGPNAHFSAQKAGGKVDITDLDDEAEADGVPPKPLPSYVFVDGDDRFPIPPSGVCDAPVDDSSSSRSYRHAETRAMSPDTPNRTYTSSTHPLMLCNFSNRIGPGEYSPGSCITSAETGEYMGIPGCFVAHTRVMYIIKMVDGIVWFIQQYPKPGGESVIEETRGPPLGDPMSYHSGFCLFSLYNFSFFY